MAWTFCRTSQNQLLRQQLVLSRFADDMKEATAILKQFVQEFDSVCAQQTIDELSQKVLHFYEDSA